ncbi:MAG: UDP-N-acetylmuramate--L-alanine ligase [Hyphomicrobiales bacterium]
MNLPPGKFTADIGPIHFVGIGGIGMSGIAEVMNTLGYAVQGSDLAQNANVERLQSLGIPVATGHSADNLGEARVVVVSSAVKADNPEVIEARARFLPVVRRAEMLAELMRFKSTIAIGGTHGKTTTTSLVAALLDGGGLDPTVINGGIINAYGTNARLGAGDWMVVESDESDGTFVKLPSDVVVVTNIDPEHLDHYGDFDALRIAFKAFVENIPFYGFAVMCIDHPEVQALIGNVTDRRIITYGLSPQAKVRLTDLRFEQGDAVFSIEFTSRRTGEVSRLDDLRLPMPGEYNALNACAAVAVADELGIPAEKIRSALESFSGVKRRFTKTGVWNGIPIFDDYGHHPVEIAAVLKAARDVTGDRVIAVMQPHRYTRLRDLFSEFCTCFNDADTVIVTPVYEAGEAAIDGINHTELAKGMTARGHRDARFVDGPDELPELLASIAGKDDLVICLGAGSITQWAYALPDQLAELSGNAA